MEGLSPAELRRMIAAGHPHLATALDALSPAVRDQFSRTARLCAVRKGDIIVEDGVVSADVGYVLEGSLGMTKALADGHVHVIGVLLPTDMFGRLFDGPNSHRLEALSDGQLLCFARAPFEALLREAPELERMFLVSVLDELDVAREWVLVLNGTRVVERVAAFLIILARRKGMLADEAAPSPVTIQMPLARADFARCLGVRPESLSRALHRLARQGMIGILDADRFEILDLPALVAASGRDLDEPAPTAGRTGGGSRRTV